MILYLLGLSGKIGQFNLNQSASVKCIFNNAVECSFVTGRFNLKRCVFLCFGLLLCSIFRNLFTNRYLQEKNLRQKDNALRAKFYLILASIQIF